LLAAALLVGSGLVAALAIGVNPRQSGPELAASGANHATVSAADSANGPVAMGNGVHPRLRRGPMGSRLDASGTFDRELPRPDHRRRESTSRTFYLDAVGVSVTYQ